MARWTVVAIVAAGCLGCTGRDPPDAGRFGLSFIDPEIYPNLALRRPSYVEGRGMEKAVRATVGGLPATIESVVPGAGLAVRPSVDLAPGQHSVTADSDDGRHAESWAPQSFHSEGFYNWSWYWAKRPGLGLLGCGGPLSGPGFTRRICVGSSGYDPDELALVMTHFDRVTGQTTATSWFVMMGGPDLSHVSFAFAVDDGASVDPATFLVAFASDVDDPGVMVAGHPLDWAVGEARLSSPGRLRKQPCGLALWRGAEGIFAVFSEPDGYRAARWNPRELTFGELFPVSTPDGAWCSTISAHEFIDEGAGNKELVAAPYRDTGMVLMTGTPTSGFQAVAGWLEPGYDDFTQRVPSFVDVDRNGLPDVVAKLGSQVHIFLQHPAADGGVSFEDRADVIPLPPPPVFGVATAVLIHPRYADTFVFVGWSGGYEGFTTTYRLTSDLQVFEENWRAATMDSTNDANLVWDVDGDGYLDLVGSRFPGNGAALWRRPDFEEEDGVSGPRAIEEITLERFIVDALPDGGWPDSGLL